VAPYAIIRPGRVHLDSTPADYDVAFEKLKLQTSDTIKLVGYHIPSNTKETRGVLILVHGVGGCKEHFVALGARLSKMGIASYLFDERAHGESGGEYCTYGFYEKNDIRNIVDLIKREYPELPIGIWGNSLGGAVALQALEIDKRLEFGLIESTFTNLHDITFDYKKRILKGIGIRAISNYALKRAGEIANFDPGLVQPLASVKNIEQPIFMAHGDQDYHISFEYGKALFNNLKTTNKTWYRVKGGTHVNMSKQGGEEYRNALFNFVERNVQQ
jgi:alpha-beta hydrolase superfamily lysophospholipase